MASPDISQQANYQDGNSVFDSVFILEKLNYDFTKSGPITISELNVLGISTFNSDVTFGGDISLDEITCRNADVTGIATVSGNLFSKSNLYLTGALVDTSGDTGNSGQILASTGSGINWIDANTTSVLNATNVGVNLNGTNANQFVSFFGASSGNNPNRVDAAFTYNPSTNTMSGINYSGTSTFTNSKVTGIATAAILEVEGQLRDGDGNFGSAGQVLTSDGTDTKWDASSNLPAGSSAKIAITDVTSGTPRLLLATGSGTQKDVLSNSNLTYNTSTQVITGKISTLSNHDTDDLSEGSTNQYFTTARARASVSAAGDLSYNSSNGQFSVNVPSAFVSGMIILWSGNTGNIPSGFVLCDGNNGTPNLTDRFVVGAGAAYSPGATGGNNSQTLSLNQIPSHSHTINNHTHSFSASATTGNPNTSLTGSVTRIAETYAGAGTASGIFTKTGNINSPLTPASVDSSPCGGFSINATHTHNLSVSGTTGNPSNTGTNSQGGGQSIDIRPKYYALCYIMKT
jgi:hypothetical protein